ncbi:hypothetical protein L7F22_028458 [Adiantum nelumboides]|nr:hypothetical protein [Adiantum nelumboides]
MGDAMKADGAFIGQDVSATPLIGKLRLHIQGYVDKEDFFIFLLKLEDVILGAPWFDRLATSIIFPERKICFKFKGKNMYINAHESGSTIPFVNDQAFDKSIKSSVLANMIFVKVSLNGVNETQLNESEMHEDLGLFNFLNQFQDVIIDDIPRELPPKQEDDDHIIELLPGSSPPNKPPYRVSHAQQEEIMRQVNELVEKGMHSKRALRNNTDGEGAAGACPPLPRGGRLEFSAQGGCPVSNRARGKALQPERARRGAVEGLPALPEEWPAKKEHLARKKGALQAARAPLEEEGGLPSPVDHGKGGALLRLAKQEAREQQEQGGKDCPWEAGAQAGSEGAAGAKGEGVARVPKEEWRGELAMADRGSGELASIGPWELREGKLESIQATRPSQITIRCIFMYLHTRGLSVLSRELEETRMALVKDERIQFGRFFYRFPEGESGADVFDRVTSFLESLWRDIDTFRLNRSHYTDLNLVIISHGLTMRIFLMRWFKWTVEQFELLHNPKNCEICVMQLGLGGEYSLAVHHSKKELEEWGLTPDMITEQEWRAKANRGQWYRDWPWCCGSFFDHLKDSPPPDPDEYASDDDQLNNLVAVEDNN